MYDFEKDFLEILSEATQKQQLPAIINLGYCRTFTVF